MPVRHQPPISGLSKVEGWLSPTTAHIMTTLADQQTLDGIAGGLAEIGIGQTWVRSLQLWEH